MLTRYISYAVASVVLSSCASSKMLVHRETPDTLNGAKLLSIESVEAALLEDASYASRIKSVREEGVRYGHNLGMIARAKNINDWLMKNNTEFAVVYNFGQLMIDGKYLPARIDRVAGYKKIEDGRLYQTRLSYRIASKPELVIGVPTHLEYLYQNVPPVYKPNPVTLPVRSEKEEIRVWREGLSEGFDTGVIQVTESFKFDFAELVRDYTGMARYIDLINKGILPRPVIMAEDKGIAISADGQTLNIGDEVYFIEDNSQFVSPQLWEPRLETGMPSVLTRDSKGTAHE